MEPISVAGAAEIILAASERLAELLLELEGTPVDPDAVRLELLPKIEKFAAYVRLDREHPGAAIVEISPHVVIDTVEALRKSEWNFSEQDASDGAADESSGTAIEPILELALQWVMLHELAHWGLGHLGYRAALGGAAGARLSCADNSFGATDEAVLAGADNLPEEVGARDLSPEEYRCIELQADFEATLLLDILHEEVEDEARSQREGEIRIPAFRQSVALAAGVAILMVQRSRGKRAAGQSGLRHPSPEARALNVMSVLLTQSVRHLGSEDGDGIRIPMDDDLQVQFMRDVTLDTLRMYYRYLAPFAEAVEVEQIFSNPTLVPARMSESPSELVPLTARDLLVFLLETDAKPDRFETAGGRELAALRPYNLALRRKLAPYAVWPV